MPPPILLASTSATRAMLLRNAGLSVDTAAANIDEPALRLALDAEGLTPRDQADALAEAKARKISRKRPDAMVIGCDQNLAFRDEVLAKPSSPAVAREQLMQLRGQTHVLHSAVVIYENDQPVWRHIGTARLTMRAFSDDYLGAYLARQGTDIRTSVGCYKLEGEGVRLFSRIDGDYFTILGLPLLELLGYLTTRGVIES